MGEPKRICAIHPIQWVVFLCIAILGLSIQSYSSGFERLILVIPSFALLFVSIYHFIYTVYLTEEGVECCRFGKVYRTLPWSQVAYVCTSRGKSSLGGRGDGPIVMIIPLGCSPFDNGVWGLYEYLYTYRNKVIWIDYTKRNIQFIEQYYGKIMNRS